MPIIAYKCADCEEKFEVFYTSQSKRDIEEPDEVCPKCESKNKEKEISTGTSFILKGNKWASKGGY